PADAEAATFDATWPPAGAEPVDIEFLYDRLAELGLGYGPAFQGLRAAWRRGAQVFAEIALDDQRSTDAARFGLHPALFDAALHAALLDPGDARLWLPFVWSGVRLHAGGASSLRVRIAPAGEHALSLTTLDENGA